MSDPRRPASFRPPPSSHEPPQPVTPRAPRALGSDDAAVTAAQKDFFDADPADALPTYPVAPRSGFSLKRLLAATLALLVSLAVGLWVDRLIRALFARADWLGWLAAGLAALALLALLLILVREVAAIVRLASVEKMRARAFDVMARNDAAGARDLIQDLARFVSAQPETAAGRRALAALQDDVIDGTDLVRVAEGELLAPLDKRARTMILETAQRVCVVTAVSPRALVDLLYVLYESGRLIRRLAQLYGGRPGSLGFFRLARNVLAHLAVTGSIAVGDSLVHQVVGHGLAARLSARLGEGVVNGLMTVRIGIAAMETARPLPFQAVARPGIGEFLSPLTAFANRRSRADTTGPVRGRG